MFKKKSIYKLKLELKQKKVGELIDKMLEEDLEIHFSPLSQEYFILDSDNYISICISRGSVRISNHSYLYEIPFSLNALDIYIKKVRIKIQERTNNIKKELFKNEIELISKLSDLYGNEQN